MDGQASPGFGGLIIGSAVVSALAYGAGFGGPMLDLVLRISQSAYGQAVSLMISAGALLHGGS